MKVDGANARFESAHRFADGSFDTYAAEVCGAASPQGATLAWTFGQDARATGDYVWIKLDAASWKGGSVIASDRIVSLPRMHEVGKNVHLATGESSSYAFAGPDGRTRFTVAFGEPVSFHCMDDREWNVEDFVWRFSRTADAATPFELTVGSDEGVSLRTVGPYAIASGADWIPLRERGTVAAGSALDFSSLTEGPCGKYGRVVARGDHFEFARKPGVRQRFYGPNACNGANVARADVIVDVDRRVSCRCGRHGRIQGAGPRARRGLFKSLPVRA